MSLNSHISRVEKHGFDRGVFPLQYNGHDIALLQNDAHWTDDGRLLFHFTLHCVNCQASNGISSRLPSDDTHAEYHLTVAKVSAFGPFTEKCG